MIRSYPSLSIDNWQYNSYKNPHLYEGPDSLLLHVTGIRLF